MKITKKNNFRIINQVGINMSIPCYFFGYFKSPGLIEYPNYKWVNDDFNLIKNKKITEEDCLRIANNLFLIIKKFKLVQKNDYLIMIPLKSTSISNLKSVILALNNLILEKLNFQLTFIDDLFLVQDYPKFWENRLKLTERKSAIANKIKLKSKYYNFFSNKKIIIIDDVVSTGTSILEVSQIIKKFNKNLIITAIAYGSVYQWEKLYC